MSTGLAQLFASHHNDDRKVIAFSDNVQDAAHRGSFFAARTWRNSVRMAIAQVVEEHDGISLAELPQKVEVVLKRLAEQLRARTIRPTRRPVGSCDKLIRQSCGYLHHAHVPPCNMIPNNVVDFTGKSSVGGCERSLTRGHGDFLGMGWPPRCHSLSAWTAL